MQVQDLKLKNEDLDAIVKRLDRRREFAEKNHMGTDFQQIILHLGTLYPEDKTMLYSFFFDPPRQTRRGQGGKVKLTKIKPSNAAAQNGTEPCDGCEKEHTKVTASSSVRQMKSKTSKAAATEQKEKDKVRERKKFDSIKDCENAEDIIDYFGENEAQSLDAMRAYLEAVGVSVGTAKRAKTIATKILRNIEEGV